jgi:hypothetical protein
MRLGAGLQDWRGRMFCASLRLATLGLAAAALAAPASTPGYAQAAAQRPTITVAATLTADAAAQSPLVIRVGPAATLPRNSFVRIRGLPPLAALSEGHSIAPGSWAVPLTALADLKVALPPDATGRSEILITLVAVDGSVLADAKATLVVSTLRASAGASVAEREVKPPAGASIFSAGADLLAKRGAAAGNTSGPMTPEDRERAIRLLQKGEAQLAEGNVSSARLFYEKAADAGLAQAAMALAATFDAAELSRLSVRGIQADTKQARQWYERALQLGASEAEPRLRRLGAN